MKIMRDNLFLFFVGSIGYGVIELAYRGYTHWTMMVTGGLCFFLLYRSFEELGSSCPLWIKGVFGTIFITAVEFFVGCLVNLQMGWEVWDYSNMSYQVLGQISLIYSVFWFFLTVAAVLVTDAIQRIRAVLIERKRKYG